MIAEHTIEALRDRADIVALALDLGLDLRQRGSVFWARCPVHEERTPSFKLDPRTGRGKCFGCGWSTDSIGLLQQLARLDFREAAAELGRRCGLEIKGGASAEPSRLRPRPRPAPRPPRPQPSKREQVAQLWRRSLAAIREAEGADVRAYLEERLGAEVAAAAVDLDLVGALPRGARWAGRQLRAPHRLVSPLFELPPMGAPVSRADQEPVDLALRQVRPLRPKEPKVKSLFEAAGGVPRCFGLVGAALADADGDELAVVEGQLNALVWAVALAPGRGWLGLHGVGAAAAVADRLRDEVLALRREGVGGPARIVIDTDLGSGDEAAAIFADLAAELGIPAQRTDRTQGV